MNNKPHLRVPSGWRIGEPLLIDRYRNGNKFVWVLTQRPSFNFNKPAPSPDDVHEIRFYNTNEFFSFIHWWYDGD